MHAPVASEERYAETRRVTLTGALVNAVLSAIQILAGWFGNSQALLADGLHTLSDLATDGLVLVAARLGKAEADEDHPYGHARFETAGTFGLASLLLLVGLELGGSAIGRLLADHPPPPPERLALYAAFAGILAKEVLYHYTVRVGRRIHSQLLVANAWHHRSDAISSVIVVLGVAGAMAGWPYLDAAAALAVAVMIVRLAWGLAWPSLQELVDTALEPEKVAQIRRVIEAEPGVQGLHVLRTRRLGHQVLADVHLQVDPRITVSEGHHVGERVRCALIEQFPEVADVLVHIDPEDDEVAAPCESLPNRQQLLPMLLQRWKDLPGTDSEGIRLHYRAGKIEIELLLPLVTLQDGTDARTLRKQYQEGVADLPAVSRVELLFR